MLESLGSDAEQFAPPAYYDEDIQVPAICLFSACSEAFARQAYRDGVRRLPAFDRSDPQSDLRQAAERFAMRESAWLLDTWTGREIYPRWAPHTLINEFHSWHSTLEPQTSGAPGLPAFLPPSMVGSLRHARDIRRTLDAIAPQRRKRLDGHIGLWQVASRPEFWTP